MIHKELSRLQAEGRPIKIGSSGAAWMGSGFVAQVAHVPGMEIVMLTDADLSTARQVFIDTGIPADKIVEAHSPSAAMDALLTGKKVITADYQLAAQVDGVDIVTDVTFSPAIGAETAYAAIKHGKPVVMVNIEADVTVGRMLKHLARRNHVLYSVSSGDEPGCLAELYDFVSNLGFEVMVIGKGKNNPLNPAANPDTVAESARKANKDPFQVASYVDGTKTSFEMTCAANATGCKPMKRGMFGPEANLETASEIFALEADGGITKFPGAVDFVQGKAMSGGVFITVRVTDPRISADLKYLNAAGKGQYFTFFRPYHLWFLEAPISVARAYLYHEVWLEPQDAPVADVITIAKKPLKPGDELDAFGGHAFSGSIEVAAEAQRLNALPVGLAPGARIVREKQIGDVITWEDVTLDEDSLVVKLRRMQDAL